jgi:membrane-associated phospholipid phosphatase
MLKGLILSFGILLTGLSVVLVDQDLTAWFDQPQHEEWRLRARHITDIGLGEHWFLLALLVYVTARWLGPRLRSSERSAEIFLDLRRWALHFFAALLGAGILLQSLKAIVGRQRPHMSPTHDPLVFEPFTTNWYFHSLPSGHTQVLFTVATAMAMLWPRMAFGFYTLAGALSFTRVMTLQHFLSDVIAGAVVGYLGSMWVRGILKKRVPLPKAIIGVRGNRL